MVRDRAAAVPAANRQAVSRHFELKGTALNTRRVITSAEPFGFGPVSKLRSVGKLLGADGWAIDFVGTGSALAYAREESEVFRSVTALESPDDLLRLDAADYDAAVSVMDPFLALWAHRNGLPCLYVDSLFWFWTWQNAEHLNEQWNIVTAADAAPADGLELLQRLPMPTAEYLGHRAASVSCVQRTVSTAAVSDAMREITPVVTTGAIVDLSRQRSAVPDIWTVSLSGLINPLITHEEAARWATAAIRLVDEAFTSAGIADAKIYLTGNSDVIANLEGVPPRFEFEPREAGAVLDLFNRSHACLTPPGLTTMLESLAYECPVIPLPPQHYGHERILREFSNHNADAFPQAVTAEQLGVFDTGVADADTRRLIEAFHQQAQAGSPQWASMVASMADTLRRALDSRSELLDRQRDIVGSIVGGFSGAQEVRAAFDAMMG